MIPAARLRRSFMLVRLGFMCRGFEGLLPLANVVPVDASTIPRPFSSLSRECEGRGDSALVSVVASRSRVYWFLPILPLRAGGRPFFLCETVVFVGGGVGGGAFEDI